MRIHKYKLFIIIGSNVLFLLFAIVLSLYLYNYGMIYPICNNNYRIVRVYTDYSLKWGRAFCEDEIAILINKYGFPLYTWESEFGDIEYRHKDCITRNDSTIFVVEFCFESCEDVEYYVDTWNMEVHFPILQIIRKKILINYSLLLKNYFFTNISKS